MAGLLRVRVGPRFRPGDGGKASRGTSRDLDERAQPNGQLGARGAEGLQAFLDGSLERRRVLEVPMQGAVWPGQGRARLAGGVGQRDHVVEPAVEQLGDRLGALAPPVDADLGEHLDGHRVDGFRLRAARRRLEIVAAEVAEQGLRDLAPSRVAVAYEQDADRREPRPAARRVGDFHRPLEVGELQLEALELLALLRDAPMLLGEGLGKCGVDAAAGEAALRESPCLRRPEPEPAQREHHREAREVGVGVLAVAVVGPRGRRQDAGGLVPADTGRGDAGTSSEGRDVHGRRLSLAVAARSSLHFRCSGGPPAG